MPVFTRSKSSQEDTIESPPVIEQGVNMASAEKPQLTLDDILAEIREGNTTTNQKLSKLEEKIDNNQKLIQDYIKSNDAEVKKVRNKVDKIENKQKIFIAAKSFSMCND